MNTYYFNWIGRGYNTVKASSKEEAIAKVKAECAESEKKYPTHVKLVIDETSLKVLNTHKERERFAFLAGASCD